MSMLYVPTAALTLNDRMQSTYRPVDILAGTWHDACAGPA